MFKPKRIFIQTWLDLKPYKKQQPSDFFYLKLANDIKYKIATHSLGWDFMNKYSDDGINTLSCILASYLEDLVSKSNIWNTFIRLNKELYDKPLPFYDCVDYVDEEINVEDVAFLIWYYRSCFDDTIIVDANKSMDTDLAACIFDILEDAWEIAPENSELLTLFTINPDEDYYLIRLRLSAFMMETYLFIPDSAAIFENNKEDIIEEHENNPHLAQLVQNEFDQFLFSTRTKLLALRINEWFANILGSEHPLYESILTISPKITGNFTITHKDSLFHYFEHIATKRTFPVITTSLEGTSIELKPGDVVFISLIRWQQNWWFSGVLINHINKQDVIDRELKSQSTFSEFVFLDLEQFPEKISEQLSLMNQAFLELTNGSNLVFMPHNKVEEFVSLFIEQHNQNVTKGKPFKKDFNSDNFELSNLFEGEPDEIIAVFLNPKSGLEFGRDIQDAFPIPTNPFYNENSDQTHNQTKIILYSDQFSVEFCHYLIEKCKHTNPFFQSELGKTFLSNTDFLLRFYKGMDYATLPTITIGTYF